MTTQGFSRKYRIGSMDTGYARAADVTVRVEYRIKPDGGQLSIQADAKRPGARDIDMGGQMDEAIRAEIGRGTFAYNLPDWTPERVGLLLDIWDRWHLNDMRAGCEHQRAEWDTSEVLTTYRWTLDTETTAERYRVKRDAERRLEAGETVTLTDAERMLLALPYDVTTTTDEAPDRYAPSTSGYRPHVQRDPAGRVRPTEHPGGLLGRPCETCGYRYATAWLREDVPAEILAWLEQPTNWTPAQV